MAVSSVDEAKELLYGLPTETFVAERDVLVKALRAEKNRDLANEVKGLRKPSAVAAEVNRVARADQPGVALILEAAALLRAAQAGLLDENLNVAELQQQYRAAIHALAQTAESKRVEVRAALEAATIDLDSNEALQSGSLVVIPKPVSVFGPDDEVIPVADELAVRRALRRANTSDGEEQTRSPARSRRSAKSDVATETEQAEHQAATERENAETAAATRKAEAAEAAEAERRRIAEKAAKKERAERRKALAKQHREALRVQVAALDDEAAAASASEEHVATIGQLEEELETLDQQREDIQHSLTRAHQDREEANEAQAVAKTRAREADAVVQQLSEAIDAVRED